MANTLTPSTQDYLEVILQLSKEDNAVRITDIAKSLDITKASATQAINTLIDEGLVLKEKYGPVTFTVKGKREAIKVKKTHKIIREFLTKVLEVDADIADKDACLIEHVISPQSIAGMVAYLEKGNYEISADLNLEIATKLFRTHFKKQDNQ